MTRFLTCLWLASFCWLVSAQETLRINEFVASNSSYSPVGSPPSYSDWIEIHNFGASPVNLDGWHLTDSRSNPTKYRFPAQSLPAGGYLVVFASGTNKTTPRLEAAFTLNVDGEYLALVKPDGTTVLHAYTNVPPQFNNVSFGLDAGGEPRYFTTPTPAAANNTPAAPGYVSTPRFSVSRGFYDLPFTVTLSSETAGASVRYSTNGIPPTATTGLPYTGPIQIGRTTPLTARAFKDGLVPSHSETHTYFFLDDVIRQSPTGAPPPGWPASWGANTVDYGMDPDIVNHAQYGPQVIPALKALPTFSIVMNLNDLFNSSTGIYANPGQDGRDWERPCSIEFIQPDGSDGFHINGGIRIRGGFSRSTGNPKHALRLFFREEYGEPQLEYPMYGPGAADEFENLDLRTFQNYSWSFQGDPNGVFLRDMFSRDSQLAMGHNAERGRYAHLYINGIYWGLYDAIERPEASYGEQYFGGDKDDYDVVKVEAGPYTINATDGSMAAWTAFYNTARAGITNNTVYYRLQGKNPDGTTNPDYPIYLDPENLIDYMLVIFYGGNLDAPISNFLGNTSPNNFYAMRSRTNRMGFVYFAHDSEHTLLNVNEDRTGPYPSGDTGVSKSNPQWIWQKLLANAEFKLFVADRVHKHFFNRGALTPESARARFSTRTNEIQLPVIAESARWGDSKRASPLTQANWLNAAANVANFINQRSTVILGQMRADGLYPALAAPSFSQHGGVITSGFRLTMFGASGTLYYTIDGTDPRLIGGAVSPSARSYSSPITISESTRIKARNRDASGNWSALNDADFIVAQTFTELVITEIMYHPPDEGTVDGQNLEFIELKNTSSRQLDLSGVHFSDGVSFRFPNGTRLEPNQFLVLVSHADSFANKYPNLRIDGIFTNNLANSGERLALSHATGNVFGNVTFSDDPPWPQSADGNGFSLVVLNPNTRTTPPTSVGWRASARIGGSPGADDPVINIHNVIITEILANSDLPDTDTVELYNPHATETADIGGWYLTDSQNTPKKYRIPAGTRILPQQYLLLSEAEFNTNPGSTTNFALSSAGEEVYLFSADEAGNLTGYSYGVDFEPSATGMTIGRHLTSNSELHHVAQKLRTLGSANSGPLVGPIIISELRYSSFGGAPEFVELRNISTEPIQLFDPAVPANRWVIEGVDFTFPAGIEIPPGGFLIVAGSDPAEFRSRYGIPASVPVLGPFNGFLQDDGENVRLLRPGSPDPTDPVGAIPYITVDAVRYSNRAPWPVNPLDPSFSLERLSSTSFGHDPASWRASPIPSPGFDIDSNRAPRVNAGLDFAATYSAFPAGIPLAATVFDDALPANSPVTYSWSFVSGPAPVYFHNSDRTNATVFVPGSGLYIIKLTAHDGELSSSDEIALTIDRPTGPQVLIPARSSWRYLDDGSDQQTAWRALAFNDTNWKPGTAQLGYGGNGEVTTIGFGPNSADKFPTTYFRKKFTLNDPSIVEALTVRLVRDDGAIIYLNGEEVRRVNLPESEVNYRSYANVTVGDADEFTFFDYPIDIGALRAGENVLAVEVHQVNASSSDLSFDLELVADIFPNNSAPVVNAGSDQVITLPEQADLAPTVGDDALPRPPGFFATTWSKVSGTGTVTFENPNIPVTSASFSGPGLYTLRLEVSDGTFARSDDLQVDVRAGADPYQTWRTSHFTTAELGNPSISGDQADPDQDGHTNLQEYHAGTNPRDLQSVLRVTVETPGANTILKIRTIAGRSYTVQSAQSLIGIAWETVGQIPNATGGEVQLTLPAANDPQRYYRVITPALP